MKKNSRVISQEAYIKLKERDIENMSIEQIIEHLKTRLRAYDFVLNL